MEKIVIITGGNKGLGLGLAKVYHKNGYRVLSIARTIKEKQYELEQYSCDLTDTARTEEVFQTIFSHLDKNSTASVLLINNAGRLGEVDTISNIESSDIANTIQLNLVAPMMLIARFIENTKDWKCPKKVINISSGAAVSPYESWGMYCASKAGLDMLTRVVAKEEKNKENGVAVVSVYPGIVDTEMQTKVRTTPLAKFKSVQRFIDFHENGQLVSPEDVGEKILKLERKGVLKNGAVIDIRDF